MRQFEITQPQQLDIEWPCLHLDDYPFDDELIQIITKQQFVKVKYFNDSFYGFIANIDLIPDKKKCNMTFLLSQRISG